MNQNPSHSQTPVFVKNESNTKPVLYQHPTEAEMQTPFSAYLFANLRDFLFLGLILSVLIGCWFALSLLLTSLFGG